MRLIDADELIEHAWRDKLDSRELIAEMIETAPTIKEIPTKIPITVFEQLISQKQKTGWIPVSERLPDKNMACLVAVGKFNLTQTAMYSDLMGIMNHRIFYQGDYGNNNFENITQYVNAWMPLPQPYKAESEDKE